MDIRVLSDTGYFERCRQVQAEMNVTGREAWEVVEHEMQAQFGLRRFLSYENYRLGKTAWYRRMKTRPVMAIKKIRFYEVSL